MERKRFAVDEDDAVLAEVAVGAAIVDEGRDVEKLGVGARRVGGALRVVVDALEPVSAVRVDGAHDVRHRKPSAA